MPPLASARHRSLASQAALSALALALLAIRYAYTGSPRYGFFVWNLFLAWVQLGGAYLFERTRGRILTLVSGAIWLAFFPNAPYLITDLIHLRPRPDAPFWFDIGLFASLAAAGLFLGLTSLERVHVRLHAALGEPRAWACVIAISYLAGLAIDVGRFLRWNSWDVVARPAALLRDVLDELTRLRPWGVSVVFGALILASYLAYRPPLVTPTSDGPPC